MGTRQTVLRIELWKNPRLKSRSKIMGGEGRGGGRGGRGNQDSELFWRKQ